jgi:hypothetical protein
MGFQVLGTGTLDSASEHAGTAHTIHSLFRRLLPQLDIRKTVRLRIAKVLGRARLLCRLVSIPMELTNAKVSVPSTSTPHSVSQYQLGSLPGLEGGYR